MIIARTAADRKEKRQRELEHALLRALGVNPRHSETTPKP
jgi:hypothetical protein